MHLAADDEQTWRLLGPVRGVASSFEVVAWTVASISLSEGSCPIPCFPC